MNDVRGEENNTNALEFYHEAAERGDVHSQVQLGKIYLHGAGVDRDYKLALVWYLKAAQQGDGEALADLGLMHEKGLGVDLDLQKALVWYKKSIALGSALGQIRLGDLYLNGSGVEQSTRKALACYQKSAEQGKDPESAGLALLRLGAMHCRGRGVEKDLRKGFDYYNQAAKLGNAEAQLCVGTMYRDGMGVGRDHKKALEWFQRSAKQNKVPADSAIGDIYRDGLVVEKNIPEAIRWYKKAAAKGDKYARMELLKLQHEEGTPARCRADAAPAGRGVSQAKAEVTRIDRPGTVAGKKEEKAREWRKKAITKWNMSVRGKLQRLRQSIGAGLLAEKKIPRKATRPAVPSTRRQARKAPAPRTLLVASTAMGMIAISLMILWLGRGREADDAPESLPPIIAKTAASPQPELPTVPAEILMLPPVTPPKANAGLAPRKAKVGNPLPIPEANPAVVKAEPVGPLLRREYKSLDQEEVTQMLSARNLFDAERNPGGGFQHQYEPMSVAGLTLIVDRATNLVWTRQQIPVKMNLDKTLRWIESLNRVEYGGIRGWRLPTIEEAASLLKKNTGGETIFLDDVFGGGIKAIWTGDSVTGSESWIVDFQHGVIGNAKSKSRLMALMVSSK